MASPFSKVPLLLSIAGVVLLTACEPSEDERQRLRSELAVAEIMVEKYVAEVDSVAMAAPTRDSMLAVIRGPLMDSLGHWQQRRDEAERALR